MFNLPKLGQEHSYYDGSRAFEWLADLCGLSVDLMNFLICQILALLLASFFRSVLHPSKVSSGVRHAFGLILGLLFGYFCFGQQAVHIAGLPAICYIVIRTTSPQIVQRSVMIVALLYLSCIHLHRQIYDYGSYSLDITGPLMIITQKVTSLAFSIHDGYAKEKDLTEAQQYHAIKQLPSALEYFSYLLHFQGLMAGPMVFYNDYIEFIEGYNLLKNTANTSMKNKTYSKEIILEPSPMKAVVKKIISSTVCAYIFMILIPVYPIKTLKDDDFINKTTIIYKIWYIMVATTTVRFKYYHAWLWADAICNNAGLGFNGYDENGTPKWDRLSNVDVFSFEFAKNMREAINSWNMGTNKWLRFVVYERVPKKYGTTLTFSLSALWHGFYPGYYLTFATGALFVEAARCARKMFRHLFQRTLFTSFMYDIITFFTTRICMGYITFPFVLLEFWASLQMYLNLYMCLHLIVLFTIFILPKFIKGERNKINDNLNSKEIKMQNSNADVIKSMNTNTNTNPGIDYGSCVKDATKPIIKAGEAVSNKYNKIEEFIDKNIVNGIVDLKDNLAFHMNDLEPSSQQQSFYRITNSQ